MIKNLKFSFIVLMLLLQAGMQVFGSNYSEAWKFLSQNNRAEARKSFNLALNEPQSKAEALLGLSFIDLTEGKNTAAFANFMQFYDISANPFPYLYAMNSLPFFIDNQAMAPVKLAFFEKIVADPKMNGTLKAMVYEKLGTYYRNRNDFKKSADNYARMGTVNNWQVLGSFDNTSESGFNKDWGVVEKARESDVFKNKVDAEVRWYNPVYNKENNWFMFDYFFNLNSALMYAQTFVTSATDQDAYVRTGTSGSLKVWVNDALVTIVPEERNCDLDIYASKVKLNQGVNRILVQIGSGELDRANFLLRLTDVNAHPLNNISSTATYADYKKAEQKPVEPLLPFFAEQFFEEKIAADPENPINYLLLSETYLRNDKAFEATGILKKLEKFAGESTLTSFRLYEAYLRAKNQTDAEKEMETIKSSDPESLYSLNSKYAELNESEMFDEAETVLKRIIELYGESPETDGMKLAIASNQKKYDVVIALAQEFFKKYPDRYEFMNLNYIIMKDVNKKPAAAIKIVEKYSKTNYNEDASDLMAKYYFEKGDAVKGLAHMVDMLNKSPYATGYYDNLINTLFQMQQYDQAIAYAEKALKIAPYLPYFYKSLGSIYKNMNQPEKAKENFKKAIYYAPNSYDSRTDLRLLEGKKNIYELFPKVNLAEMIAKAPTANDYPEDNSMFLLNSYQQVVYPEGAKEYRREVAVKILKQSGIERWKDYGIGYNGYLEKLIIDKAEVFKANGSVVKAETDDDNQIVFTNLEVNDVLHVEYRIQDFSSGKLAGQFFDKFLLQYSIPSVLTQYSLLVPDDKTFNYKVTNGDVKPEISTIENLKLYKWEVSNMPGVKNESYISDYMDIAPTLHYSSLPDWDYVSNWYKDITTSKFNADYVLKETYKSIMAGQENATKIEKAKLIYNYILENISYSSVDFLQSNYIPQKASRTITTRLGDCKDLSTLFVTLCREADIDANLVLILTRDNGHRTLVLPEIGFNHCIAQLNMPDKTYFLELTDNSLPFGAANKNDLNAEILPVPLKDKLVDGRLPLMKMPHRISNSSVRMHKVRFDKNDMLIQRDIAYVGLMASYERGEFRHLGADEQLQNKSEAVAKQFKVATKMTDLSFKGLDSLTDTVHMSAKIEVKNAMQDVAGMKIFTLPWTDINSLDIVSLESRTLPMEYWEYQIEDRTTETIVIDLPAGRKFAEEPQNIKYACPTAIYTVNFDLKTPGKVTITRYFERLQDQVSPADYPAFREFMNQVSEFDNKQFAIK